MAVGQEPDVKGRQQEREDEGGDALGPAPAGGEEKKKPDWEDEVSGYLEERL